MNKNFKSKNRYVHLYNPKEEGLGLYDVHYINAYKKVKDYETQLSKKDEERYAA
tara:strand:- start:463 stop:624 length:162 start_codon:yes stop_codon:yes gene_type:complete